MQYTIVRQKRKSVSLTVLPSGTVQFCIPVGMSDEDLNAFLYRHRRWVASRLAFTAVQKPRFDEGETVNVFGVPYLVMRGRTGAKNGVLYLPEKGREGALKRILTALSLAYFTQKTAELAQKYGFSYERVRISSAKTRWGSCSGKKVISYSVRGCLLPTHLTEYLIVHELCHTKYMNHSRAFWSEVARCMPDYRQRRKQLKMQSGVMNVFPF